MTFTNILAQVAEGAAPTTSPNSGMNTMLLFGLFMLAMWFLMIAPQNKRRKEHQKMLSELKPGDQVMTSGGIFGTVQQVREDRLVLKISDSTRIEVSKAYVGAKLTVSEDTEKK